MPDILYASTVPLGIVVSLGMILAAATSPRWSGNGMVLAGLLVSSISLAGITIWLLNAKPTDAPSSMALVVAATALGPLIVMARQTLYRAIEKKVAVSTICLVYFCLASSFTVTMDVASRANGSWRDTFAYGWIATAVTAVIAGAMVIRSTLFSRRARRAD